MLFSYILFFTYYSYAVILRMLPFRKSELFSVVYNLRSIGLRIINSNIGLAYVILYLIHTTRNLICLQITLLRLSRSPHRAT